MEKGKVRDKCPACGVPSKMFLPHDEHISPQRSRLLKLDMHPVMVHFPEAFIVTILFLSLAGAILHGPLSSILGATIRTLGVLLPFTIALSFASGLFDGKIRFRKVKTPLLQKKMVLGAVFFFLGCAIFTCVKMMPVTAPAQFLLIAGLSAPALACAAVLGRIGTGLLIARFPG
jgi:hypothetical protein